MDTTAEGVETLDELELVRLHGCSHVQGYIYERPLDAAAATERVASGLAVVAQGARSSRSPRRTMLRKVGVEHQGKTYKAIVRNLSTTGALVEGLPGMPVGTTFEVHFFDHHKGSATSRWCVRDRMGLEFAAPLTRHSPGAAEAGDEKA